MTDVRANPGLPPPVLSPGEPGWDWKDRSATSGGTLRRLLIVPLKAWRRTIVVPIAIAATVALVSMMLPREYRAVASFYPSAPSTSLPSGLSSVARMVGVSAGGESQGPEFYASLVTSQAILRQLAESRLATSNGDSLTPLQLFGQSELSPALALHSTVEDLEERLWVHANKITSVVRVELLAPDPVLAAAAVNRLLALVNSFNVGSYQSSARATRIFLEERQRSLRQELTAAEARLVEFRRTNRMMDGSPTLQLESARLQREIALREQAYLANAQQLEQALAEEVRATPTVTIIDTATVPSLPAKPRPLLYGLLAGFLIGLVALADCLRAFVPGRIPAAISFDAGLQQER